MRPDEHGEARRHRAEGGAEEGDHASSDAGERPPGPAAGTCGGQRGLSDLNRGGRRPLPRSPAARVADALGSTSAFLP
jgi:hypothetical protein